MGDRKKNIPCIQHEYSTVDIYFFFYFYYSFLLGTRSKRTVLEVQLKKNRNSYNENTEYCVKFSGGKALSTYCGNERTQFSFGPAFGCYNFTITSKLFSRITNRTDIFDLQCTRVIFLLKRISVFCFFFFSKYTVSRSNCTRLFTSH